MAERRRSIKERLEIKSSDAFFNRLKTIDVGIGGTIKAKTQNERGGSDPGPPRLNMPRKIKGENSENYTVENL